MLLLRAGMLVNRLVCYLPYLVCYELEVCYVGGMLPTSVFAMLKNSASAAFTPAEYIKPFLDISPFCSQKAIRASLQRGQDRLRYVSYL